jgi:hypothetical protein
MTARSRGTPSAASLGRLRAGFQRALDEERRGLARGLHDSAMQTLTAVSMNLSLVERDAGGLPLAARQALADAQTQVEACASELRALSHALFPAVLGSAGLAAAVRGLVRQRGEDRLRVDIVGPLPRYGVSVELTAYRLIEDLDCLFGEGLVRGRLLVVTDDVLEVTLVGPARANSPLADVAVRQRVRAVGGRLRIRRIGATMHLDVRFPPSVPETGE